MCSLNVNLSNIFINILNEHLPNFEGKGGEKKG